MKNYASFQNLNYDMDYRLILALLLLIALGLLAVATSSIEYASERYQDPWFILRKQTIFLLLGACVGFFVYFIPTDLWRVNSIPLCVIGIALLVAVLVPGIGNEVNGSRRWISFGPISMQASEMAKLCFIVFFAGYLNRRNDFVREKWSAFFVMVSVVAVVVILLLLEPDFGGAVVMCLTLGAMMFVAGVPLLRFLLLAITGVASLGFLAILSPYRWERLLTFTDPWACQFDGGYQLVQSLIGFGRGEYFGVGLGNSVQKALFLPEAHTDFVFAIFVEEMGLLGALILISVVVYFIFKIVSVALKAFEKKQYFSGYICTGIAVTIAVQSFVNMGVASGLLPTKGLTFPFVSYGGSSLVITCVMMALIFRVDRENRIEK